MTTAQPQSFTGNVHPVPGNLNWQYTLIEAVLSAQPGDMILVPFSTYIIRMAASYLAVVKKLDCVMIIPLAPTELGK